MNLLTEIFGLFVILFSIEMNALMGKKKCHVLQKAFLFQDMTLCCVCSGTMPISCLRRYLFDRHNCFRADAD
jgi:hypothetical protein